MSCPLRACVWVSGLEHRGQRWGRASGCSLVSFPPSTVDWKQGHGPYFWEGPSVPVRLSEATALHHRLCGRACRCPAGVPLPLAAEWAASTSTGTGTRVGRMGLMETSHRQLPGWVGLAGDPRALHTVTSLC